MTINNRSLPESKEFAAYEQTLPGAAERILVLAEKEAAHRHQNEDKVIQESLKLGKRGQIFALIISMVAMGVVILSIFFSQPVAAIAPTIVALTGLTSIFTNKLKKNKV
jgi:uncharacterized membrane protein